jgi:hypothetical protein
MKLIQKKKLFSHNKNLIQFLDYFNFIFDEEFVMKLSLSVVQINFQPLIQMMIKNIGDQKILI